MKIKISIYTSLVKLLLLNSSCGIVYTVSQDRINPIMRNFEIAKLVVDSIDKKNKYPVKYEKEEIFVSSIFSDIDSIKGYFKNQYQNIEEYWKDYNRLDSLHELSSKKRKLNEVRFFEKQNHVNWIKFPFFENEQSFILPTKFEKNTWYKISHLYHYDIGISTVIFFYINDKGKIHKYELIEN